MSLIEKTLILLFISSLTVFSCKSDVSNEASSPQQSKEGKKVLAENLLGSYKGIVGAHFAKNDNGEDYIMFGKKVPIPKITYTLTLKNDNKTTLIEKGGGDFGKSDGTYKVIDETTDITKIEVTSKGKKGNIINIFLLNIKTLEGVFILNEADSECKMTKLN